MNLLEFSILNLKNDMPMDLTSTPMLINPDHIVSVKPINIVLSGNIIRGHWVRLSNGKKYKAIKIPQEIATLFKNINDEELNIINIGNTISQELESILH
jgi:2-keto-4-pentenoate hydratase